MPESEKNVDSDEAFAYTYLAGSDPDVLQRMQQIPANFPITNSHFQSIPQLAGDDLSQAMREGRVYYVDYAIMKDLENGSHPQQPKYMFAPIAAFALPRGGGPLLPFAIQTGQNPQGRTIYTPMDKWSWKIARSTVQAATNAHSAIISHLSLTHIVMEPVALCLYRNLSPKHPVYALLQPHIENTLIINNSAFKTLVGPNQFVDRMLGSTIDSNYDLIRSTRRDFDFKAQYLPNKLSRNKTLDNTTLSLYPYRDDGLLLWNEIYRWVSKYLSYYYPTEKDLAMDLEIQAWAFEIGSDTMGQVRGFASGSGVGSIQELIETVTMIIFTAGPQHAAVNFAQKSDMAYVPSAPMAGYTPELSGKNHSELDWLKFLPPLDVAVVQLTLCYMLGSVYYGRLGDYGSIFSNSPVESFLKDYQRNLKEIESTIETRNKTRRSYLHLMPSRIPQSINI
ncbi:MAG: lipoxygenase [Proteobacteria bacterium]|nr:MAG: lipoxygenase [Pseudomonadota bacterium]